jgi:glycosyltransferase involved in cell wall biosynthesis
VSGEVFVIVTARNEAARLGDTLASLARAFPAAPIWVADDGSIDATPTIAQGAGALVVSSERAIGKGGAATIAAREALSRPRARGRVHDDREHVLDGGGGGVRGKSGPGEPALDGGEPVLDDGGGLLDDDDAIFILCDGDLGESAGRLGPLADVIRRGEADVAVAAFATRAGGGFGLAVAFARWAVRRRCGLRMRTPLSGQRAMSARALRDVLPFAPGFGMEVGMTIDAVRAGHRVVELELDLSHRATGRTPVGFAHRARQLADVVRVYLHRRRPR